MRVAILADIHGNLPACEAVLEDIARMSPDYVVAAGDLALRGAHPKETLDLLFSRCHALLIGNTDSYIAGNYLGGAYREKDHWKRELLDWTRNEVGPAYVERLGKLPFAVRYSPRRGQDLYVCHANPKNLEDSLEPTLEEADLRRFFANVDAAACAFGHLHFPYRRRLGRMVIADVASAGLPRDGDLRPAYGLFTFTPRGWRVQIRRVRYPVKKATQALTARKVPGAPLLIHKLVEARYRHHHAMLEAARRHSGLPPLPLLRPPPGVRHPDQVSITAEAALGPVLPPPAALAAEASEAEDSIPDGLPLSAEPQIGPAPGPVLPPPQGLEAPHEDESAGESKPLSASEAEG
ncbi:MAG TPA: metallophosphoesterase family protein [Myxococcaceae bacterium]|nr:metallophosphoesterase family protein [Myxococcaceae bacterium]